MGTGHRKEVTNDAYCFTIFSRCILKQEQEIEFLNWLSIDIFSEVGEIFEISHCWFSFQWEFFFLHFLRSTLFLFSINYYLKTCTFGICTKQWYKQYHCRLLENRSFRSFRSFRNIFRNIFAFLLWRKTSIAWFP